MYIYFVNLLYMIIIIVIAIILAVSLFLIVSTKNTEAFSTRKITLFYSDSCGHCKNFMPEWDRFANHASKNIADLTVQKVDCQADQDTCNVQQIEGYPTVILEQNNQKIKYNGERTMDSLIKFSQGN